MLMPSTLAMLAASFHGEARGAAIGSWAAWGGVAAAIGPLVGGVLIQALSWRAIFVLALPIVIAAVGVAAWRVEESYGQQATIGDVDLLGAALATATLASLSHALIQGPQVGWTHPSVVVTASAAPLAGFGFVLHERHHRAPMLPLGLFRSRNLSAANAATLALYGIFNGGFFILTIYLQTALHYSPLKAGAATLPVTLLMIGLASRLGRVSERIGPRAPMTVGLALTGASFGMLATLRPGDGYALHVLPGVIIFGLGLALAVPPLTNTAGTELATEPDGGSNVLCERSDGFSPLAGWAFVHG